MVHLWHKADLDVITAKKQKEQYKISTFNFDNPELYNEAYTSLFENKSRFIHLFGSAGSGKSVFGCQKEIRFTYREERRNRKTLVVRKFYNTLANSVYAQIKAIIYEWGLEDDFDILKSPLSITNRKTNVQIIFVGLDDVEKVKSIQGVDRILIEEATELHTLSELDQLSLRLRGFSEVQITLMYNPINAHHWLNTEIHHNRPLEHFILKTTYRDNRFLDANYLQFLESLKFTNPNYYKVYGLGEWGQNQEGLIYPDFEVVSDMPNVQAYGLDFGYNDPCALVAIALADVVGIDKKNLYARELLYESKLTSDMLIERLNALEISKRIPIVGDSSRPEMIQALKRAGFNMQASAKGKGSIVAGINEIKRHNIKILAGSKNLIREMENYSWRNKNGEWLDEPQDGANHASDAVRYAQEVLSKPSRIIYKQPVNYSQSSY